MGASAMKVLGNESKNRFQGRKARGILGYERSKFLPFGCGKWSNWGENLGKSTEKSRIIEVKRLKKCQSTSERTIFLTNNLIFNF